MAVSYCITNKLLLFIHLILSSTIPQENMYNWKLNISTSTNYLEGIYYLGENKKHKPNNGLILDL